MPPFHSLDAAPFPLVRPSSLIPRSLLIGLTIPRQSHRLTWPQTSIILHLASCIYHPSSSFILFSFIPFTSTLHYPSHPTTLLSPRQPCNATFTRTLTLAVPGQPTDSSVEHTFIFIVVHPNRPLSTNHHAISPTRFHPLPRCFLCICRPQLGTASTNFQHAAS